MDDKINVFKVKGRALMGTNSNVFSDYKKLKIEIFTILFSYTSYIFKELGHYAKERHGGREEFLVS